MAIVNRISEQEYRELALNDPDFLWELWDGVPVEKPLMSMKHDDVSFHLRVSAPESARSERLSCQRQRR